MTDLFRGPGAPPAPQLWRVGIEIARACPEGEAPRDAPRVRAEADVVSRHDGQIWRILEADLAEIGWTLLRAVTYTRLAPPPGSAATGLVDLRVLENG